MQPWLASLTVRMYLRSTPWRTLGRGRCHWLRRSVQQGRLNLNVNGVGGGIENYPVAVFDQRDAAAIIRLGADVAHHEAVGTARKAPVRNQRHLIAQPGPDDGRTWA